MGWFANGTVRMAFATRNSAAGTILPSRRRSSATTCVDDFVEDWMLSWRRLTCSDLDTTIRHALRRLAVHFGTMCSMRPATRLSVVFFWAGAMRWPRVRTLCEM